MWPSAGGRDGRAGAQSFRPRPLKDGISACRQDSLQQGTWQLRGGDR